MDNTKNQHQGNRSVGIVQLQTHPLSLIVTTRTSSGFSGNVELTVLAVGDRSATPQMMATMRLHLSARICQAFVRMHPSNESGAFIVTSELHDFGKGHDVAVGERVLIKR